VVHVNAHATSTPEGDALEAQALVKALGSAVDGVIVTSTKSMTGHLLGGAGAIESVAAILALKEHVAPPTINLDDLDENVPVDVATEPRPLSKRGSEPMAVLNNAFGFGGHNVSLVFTSA
jgi:3-oxoacyl-[acyl-carrier-protein] synthase II